MDVAVTSVVFHKRRLGGYALWFVPVLFVALILAKVYYEFKITIYKYAYIALLLSISYLLSYYKISLPWNMSVAHYAAVLLLMAYMFRAKILQCTWMKWWVMLMSFLVVLFVSYHWRLDMCYNNILPILPITLGAIAGSVFVIGHSARIERYGGRFANILKRIGEETFIVVAFSQIIIMGFNKYIVMNPITKYSFLVALLLVIYILKNAIVNIYNKLLHRQ